mgnify:FL=1
MQCPVCTDETLVISSREGIEIDHCPRCRGVWLDRGEHDKIIERAAPSVVGSSAPPAAPPPQPRREDHYDSDRYRYDKKRRRKNFLEEIFDFD